MVDSLLINFTIRTIYLIFNVNLFNNSRILKFILVSQGGILLSKFYLQHNKFILRVDEIVKTKIELNVDHQ